MTKTVFKPLSLSLYIYIYIYIYKAKVLIEIEKKLLSFKSVRSLNSLCNNNFIFIFVQMGVEVIKFENNYIINSKF